MLSRHDRNFREVQRWLVFIFILIPLIPVAVVSAVLGTVWFVAQGCFTAGVEVFDVYLDEAQKT